MAHEIRLPDIGEGLTEAEIVSWMVEVGDEVKANQPILEVETAKAVVEISPPQGGILIHRAAPAGTTIEVGGLLAVIGAAGETWGDADPAESPTASEPGTTSSSTPPPAPAAPSRGPVKAVPLIRKLAKDLGVDLATVTGTGARGQVTRSDIAAAAGTPDRSGEATAQGSASADLSPRRLSPTRRAIAANLTRSWTEIPHVTVWGPADGTALLAAKSRDGGSLEGHLIRTAIPVLRQFPEFSANFDGETLTPATAPSIGLAVDTSAGLVVPVVVDAANRTDLEDEIARLIDAAINRKLRPNDMSGATFTISNVGAVGGGYGTPVIPYGTTAVLSVGRAVDDVIVRNRGIHIAPVFPIALSFDHRVIDGALGSRFLNSIIDQIERYA